MRNAFHALLTVNVLLSVSLLVTIFMYWNIEFIHNTAVALLCWNLSQFLVVIMFVPPIFVVYHSLMLPMINGFFKCALRRIKACYKALQRARPGEAEAKAHDKEEFSVEEEPAWQDISDIEREPKRSDRHSGKGKYPNHLTTIEDSRRYRREKTIKELPQREQEDNSRASSTQVQREHVTEQL